MSDLISQAKIDARELAGIAVQLNEILARLQFGGLLSQGARWDTSVTAVPVGAPGPRDPNVRLINVAGVVTPYYWDGSAWVVWTGGGGGGANVGDAFVTIGHPADLTAERNLAVAASLSLTDGGANNDVTLGTVAFTGDITTAANSHAATIPADTVTYAKMQNVSAASRLLGRGSAAGAGDPEELTLGTNLSLAGTVLNAASDAPVGASYLTLGLDGTLTSERVLTEGTNLTFTDTGAGGTLTVALDVTEDVQFNQFEGLQFVVENRTSDPGAPVTGQLWIRTDL